MKIKSGEILGKYKICEVLGHGGMATVYRAIQQPLGRDVALKVLHQHLTIEETVRERFLLEAQSIAQMKHPNIVQIYDFEASDEGSYISMELIDGGALDQYLDIRESEPDKFEPLPVKQALTIARDIAEALDYAHQFNIIHRDVKPANILIGTDGRYVLTDFGIATILHRNRMTADGATSGTPTYIAPEMITGDRGDVQSDIYSLGIVLFQLLTGQLPFNSENLYSILMKHINEPLPSLIELNPLVDKETASVVSKAAAKHSNDRFQTGKEFSQAIEAILESSKFVSDENIAHEKELVPQRVISSNKTVPIGQSYSFWDNVSFWIEQINHRYNRNTKIAFGLMAVLLLSVSFIFLRGNDSNANNAEAQSQASESEQTNIFIEPVPLNETFDNNDLIWPMDGAPRWKQIVDGVYEMRIEEPNLAVSAVPANIGSYKNFSYSADLSLRDGLPETGFGLIFNYSSPQNYQVFGINGFGQWSIWNLNDGVWESLQTTESGETWIYSEAIQPLGSWNTLKIDLNNAEYDLFINDQFVLRLPIDNNSNTEGQIGFYLATPQEIELNPSKVQFDNVLITLN